MLNTTGITTTNYRISHDHAHWRIEGVRRTLATAVKCTSNSFHLENKTWTQKAANKRHWNSKRQKQQKQQLQLQHERRRKGKLSFPNCSCCCSLLGFVVVVVVAVKCAWLFRELQQISVE